MTSKSIELTYGMERMVVFLWSIGQLEEPLNIHRACQPLAWQPLHRWQIQLESKRTWTIKTPLLPLPFPLFFKVNGCNAVPKASLSFVNMNKKQLASRTATLWQYHSYWTQMEIRPNRSAKTSLRQHLWDDFPRNPFVNSLDKLYIVLVLKVIKVYK